MRASASSRQGVVLELTEARIDDRDRLQDIAVLVELQVQRVRDARVRPQRVRPEIQFVVVGDRLAFGDQEDRVSIDRLRLQAPNVAVVIGGGEQFHRAVFAALQRIDIQLVHFLAQHHALAGAQGFAPLVGTEVFRVQVRLRQDILLKISQDVDDVRMQVLEPAGEIFVLELREDALAFEQRAGVIPGDGLDRRLVERLVVGDVRAGGIALRELAVGLDIHLLDAAEAAELAFDAVEVAVVIAVGAGERGLPPLVSDGDFLDAVHRERQFRDPRLSGQLVLQIELGRRRVATRRFPRRGC